MKPRNVVAFLIALLLGMAFAPVPHGQPVGEARFIAGVVGPARVTLDAQWDDFDVNQVERAFCVTRWEMTSGILRGQPTIGLAVIEVSRPLSVGKATGNSIVFRCKSGQPTGHIHPPTSCTADGSQCFLDRFRQTPETCAPSAQDRRYANHSDAPFHFVMCGVGIYSFFFPAPEAAPPDSASGTAGTVAMPRMGTTRWVSEAEATHDLISLGSMIAGVVFAVSVITLRQHKETHHFYYGAVMVAWPGAPLWVRGIGFALILDDTIQHAVQIKDPSYRSPVHKAYAVVLRWTGL